MKFKIIPVTAYQQNCTLLWCEETNKAAVVDPGGDIERIFHAMIDAKVVLEKILITHGHMDHAGAAADLAERCKVPIEGPHQGDDFWLEGLEQQAAAFGFDGARSFVPSRWLNDGDSVTVGNQVLQVRHCPGHTPGHVIFYSDKDALALVGDVLFQGSIGRTDFPGGNYDTLIRSIRERLFPLGDKVAFIPGHGPMSTFEQERKVNPFVADSQFA